MVSDAGNVAQWFPLVRTSELDGAQRRLVLQDGSRVVEDIVTTDEELRRFQYRISAGDVPVERHLGTVDVIELAPGSTLVVYSTEIEPAELGGVLGPAVEDALTSLAAAVRR
ncbi:MAG: SRPBCC family protein [Pseudonocardia sp.]